jgi:hypothetical protein
LGSILEKEIRKMYLNSIFRKEARETAGTIVDGKLGVVFAVGGRLGAVILAVQH